MPGVVHSQRGDWRVCSRVTEGTAKERRERGPTGGAGQGQQAGEAPRDIGRRQESLEGAAQGRHLGVGGTPGSEGGGDQGAGAAGDAAGLGVLGASRSTWVLDGRDEPHPVLPPTTACPDRRGRSLLKQKERIQMLAFVFCSVSWTGE